MLQKILKNLWGELSPVAVFALERHGTSNYNEDSIEDPWNLWLSSPRNSSLYPYERRQKFATQIHADLVFHACISFLRYFRMPVDPVRKMRVYTGMVPCLVPSWPQIMQIRISFRSRSDLVLISLTMPGNFYPISNLQACISFCSVSDKSGASMFLPCSHKNAAAHICPRPLQMGYFQDKSCGFGKSRAQPQGKAKRQGMIRWKT